MANELPILDLVQINDPCPMDWDAMTGDNTSRHCDQCEKSVYHLSNMTAAEAARIVTEHNGDLCVRGNFRSSDGKLVTRPTRRQWLLRFMRRTVATVAIIPMIAVLSGCGEQKLSGKLGEWVKPETPEPFDPSTGSMAMMGGLGAPPPTATPTAIPPNTAQKANQPPVADR